MNEHHKEIVATFKKEVLTMHLKKLRKAADEINEKYWDILGRKIKIVANRKENILVDIVLALEFIQDEGIDIPEHLQLFYNSLFSEDGIIEGTVEEFVEEPTKKPKKRPRENNSRVWLLGDILQREGINILRYANDLPKIDVKLDAEYVKHGGTPNINSSKMIVRNTRNVLRSVGLLEKV